ncbi:MAG: GNAT family N-acetyltransferase [Prevotellaceae bacterium]|nr:GNAT family N-acetyltransferase [Candidatus Faecinaster equi]
MNRIGLIMKLIPITHSTDPLLKDVLSLYESAFPKDERTSNEQFLAMIDKCPEMSFYAISEHGELDGMAVIWDLGICRYLLYLAVKEDKRNGGLGTEALRQLLQQSSLPIIGEVEYPESNPMASRRIGFYQRNGFHIESEDPKILNSSHHYDTCHLMLISSQPLKNIDECQRRVVDVVYKNMHAE